MDSLFLDPSSTAPTYLPTVPTNTHAHAHLTLTHSISAFCFFPHVQSSQLTLTPASAVKSDLQRTTTLQPAYFHKQTYSACIPSLLLSLHLTSLPAPHISSRSPGISMTQANPASRLTLPKSCCPHKHFITYISSPTQLSLTHLLSQAASTCLTSPP